MKKIIYLLSAVSIFTYTACKKDDNKPAAPRVLFANACISTEPVNVTTSDKNVALSAPVAYLNNSGYVSVDPGTNVKTTFLLSSSNLELATGNFNYVNGNSYSVFAIGNIKTSDILYTTDDLSAPTSGNAKVRFINLSTDTLNETMYVGSQVIDSNIKYKMATPFVQVAAGTKNIIVVEPGNIPGQQTISQVFENGKIYTVVLAGFAGGSSTAALGLTVIKNN